MVQLIFITRGVDVVEGIYRTRAVQQEIFYQFQYVFGEQENTESRHVRFYETAGNEGGSSVYLILSSHIFQ